MLIIIPGTPMPKQSDRTRAIKKKNGQIYILHYQPKEIIDEVERIRKIVRNLLPFDFRPVTTPIHVTKLHYIFPIPQSFTKKQIDYIKSGGIIEKSTKPDVTDNLNKLLFDALENIVYVNDSLITRMNDVAKYYGIEPKIILELDLSPNI